jgi:hypothetical protein
LKLAELWRRWQTSGDPEHMLTKAEATERVRQYAEAHQLEFLKPVSIQLERRELKPGDRKAGFHLVYVMTLGTTIPMPKVEVDASDGTVIMWRSFSR